MFTKDSRASAKRFYMEILLCSDTGPVVLEPCFLGLARYTYRSVVTSVHLSTLSSGSDGIPWFRLLASVSKFVLVTLGPCSRLQPVRPASALQLDSEPPMFPRNFAEG